jgi:RimJ/RimL family protein N-acetyltransferase
MTEDDFEPLFRAASDPLIWEQHPDRLRHTRERFEIFFRSGIESRGALIVHQAATGELIGSSRFSDPDVDGTSSVEIGYTFLTRPYWGGLYNGELKRLMLDFAFERVGTVYFIVGRGNQRSRQAMARIGARLVPNETSPRMTRADRNGSVLFRILKPEWAARKA